MAGCCFRFPDVSVSGGLVAGPCQSFVEELLASNSADLQQRAYELQGLISLDAHAAENIMPVDANCEDIEVMGYTLTLGCSPFS
nr:AP-4 complex subunit epsilon-like [Ipomoea trifida]GMD07022.1 AP-4 complex subunit epsilon [Ipomoea batatas]